MSHDHSRLPYRACVGAMLLNRKGHAFVGRRIDRDENGGEAWQMPQGGVDEGEELSRAALRELQEETGVTSAEIIAEAQDWLHYDLPPELIGVALKGRFRGQRQKWFALRFFGDESEINLAAHHPEFDAWNWVALDALPGLIVPFKRPVYEELVRIFAPVARALARTG
ncbi:MAG TPA: RNA pyrophosphohydrolase [Micropepsaceae bacterium]|nr:RNA pyrophosphohydrolase [Micropepsaceae bacterium]